MSPTEVETGRSAERADFLATIITTALEGGIGYWSRCERYRWWYPGLDGGTADHEDGKANAYATIIDAEGDGTRFEITIDKIATALGKFRAGQIEGLAPEYRQMIVRADRANEAGDIDADAADWIVQTACFGEVIYG